MDVYEPWKGKLERIIEECPDTKTFRIKLPQKLDYRPGQFVEVGAFGMGEGPFSISGGKGNIIEITAKNVGNVTNALHAMEKGDTVFVRGPFGNGYPLDGLQLKEVLFVAGGIGIANLKAAIEYCIERRDKFARLELFYGVNVPSEVIYKKQLKEWEKLLDLCITSVWYPDDMWEGDSGVIANKIRQSNSTDGIALMCGPSPMFKPVADELHRLQIPDERIYVSLERMMKCGVGKCGHCSLGDKFVCKDGPVFTYEEYGRLKGG